MYCTTICTYVLCRKQYKMCSGRVTFGPYDFKYDHVWMLPINIEAMKISDVAGIPLLFRPRGKRFLS